jgi:ATP-dependent helicase HrpB
MTSPTRSGDDLPIDDVLPQILASLRQHSRLVISAPPGAGKTTRVPLAVLPETWLAGRKLIVVEPRRIAARAAAERMAATLGETVGQTIGLRSRLDVRTSPASRIEVVTEGVFSRMILSDPALDGIAAVAFDEFHERSLDADEGLAFALDAQSVLRDDLRIILMSATLPANLTQTFFDAPVIASEGRAWPVETHYLGYDSKLRLEDQVAAAIRRALNEETGSILAFLPGVAEITRTAERLSLPAGVEITPLYGALTPAEQNAAIAPTRAGIRKIVLATDIAESAITIQGVRVVIDCGFARVPRFDPSLGASRLETIRLAIANADQRRGRAGRTGPGVCYRLWREAEQRGFAASPSPEIANADLTGLALDLARWGAKSPADLRWLEAPRDASWRHARTVLTSNGAIGPDGALTPIGKRIGQLALPPRLALMVVRAAQDGAAELAANIAAIMSERDLGGRSSDIDDRLARFRKDTGPRAKAMRDLARRWSREAGPDPAQPEIASGVVLARAFPERIAKARDGAPGRFILAGGRGALLDESDPLAREPWIVAADVTGSGPDLRILLAARITQEEVMDLGAAETTESARYDPASHSIRARRVVRLGAITLADIPMPSPSPALVRAGLLEAVREHGLKLIPEAAAVLDLVARVDILAATFGAPWPADFSALLAHRLEDWLGPLLEQARSLDTLNGALLADAAKSCLDWPLPRDLDRLAPRSWTTPAGRSVTIDYSAEGGPRAACKVQETFGLKTHPHTADGRIPLSLALLSPAQRPVAITRDLPGFWSGGYHDMRKDLRGRYPKHDWPEDPSAAAPTSRAKPRTW